MDAGNLLRLYIEQRRELGESELVLDRLNVDDVMRLIGATGAARAPAETPHSVRELDPADTRDWRTSLRDAGGSAAAAGSRAARAHERAMAEGSFHDICTYRRILQRRR